MKLNMKVFRIIQLKAPIGRQIQIPAAVDIDKEDYKEVKT